jgi:fumarylacetoacetate (FAA) hydrolase
MKIATYHDGSRDGQLVVVSRDLARAHFATAVATRVQPLLDDWNFLSPQLEDLYATLNDGKARHAFAFDPARCMAPLPRAFRFAWVAAPAADAADGSAAPRIEHDAGDGWPGPRGAVRLPVGADATVDAVAGVAAVTGDVARGATPAQALDGVRLLLLAGQWRWQRPGSRPQGGVAATFGPVAVTPDELGAAWPGGRLAVAVAAARPHAAGRAADAVEATAAAATLPLDVGAAIAALAAQRGVGAGSIVAVFGDAGARAAHLHPGDSLRIEASCADGLGVFGAIEQTLQAA